MVCINGAAAHLVEPGHKVILATSAQMEEEEARKHQPIVIQVGIGRAGYHLREVSEIFQRAGDPLYINPLPSTGRIAAVGEHTDPEGIIL